MFKLISVYEPILYRFGYGEYISYRENAKDFAQPNRKRFHELINKLERIKYIDFEDIFPYILGTKQYGINFHNINQKQTIEFRMPNGTIEEIIWQNNINFYISFLKYMTSAKFDPEFIDYKYQNIDMQKENLNNYCALHLKEIGRAHV